MTAEDVRACLAIRWPDAEYLSIPEAPQESDRGGRKLDLLVISLWRSRGLQLDGVEIKVSTSDWGREVAGGAKADWWWRHTNRFWVAVPAEMAARVKADLPPTWGLLSCEAEKAPRIAVQCEYREAESLSWGACVGLMRAAADCGVNALRRAELRGREQGHREGREAAERRTPDGAATAALADLRERVGRFERASGVDLSRHWDVDEVGAQVALIQKERLSPGYLIREAARIGDYAVSHAERLVKTCAEARAALEAIAGAMSKAAAPQPREELRPPTGDQS